MSRKESTCLKTESQGDQPVFLLVISVAGQERMEEGSEMSAKEMRFDLGGSMLRRHKIKVNQSKSYNDKFIHDDLAYIKKGIEQSIQQ